MPRDLLGTGQVVPAREQPASLQIALAEVGDLQQALPATDRIAAAQHVPPPVASQRRQLARLDIIVQRGHEDRWGVVPLIIVRSAVGLAHGKGTVPSIRRPAHEAGERPMSNRADGGNVTAQQNNRQRFNVGYQLHQAHHGPGGIEAVVPVEQDDRDRTARLPHLSGERRKPLPEPPRFDGQDRQRGLVDGRPPF